MFARTVADDSDKYDIKIPSQEQHPADPAWRVAGQQTSLWTRDKLAEIQPILYLFTVQSINELTTKTETIAFTEANVNSDNFEMWMIPVTV